MHATPRNSPAQRFLRGLATSPTGIALQAGDDQVTYEELHELALRWAGFLLHRQDAPPRAVAVLADKGVESYAGILAALYCGAAAVPLHPAFPAARTRFMLEASGASQVIADDAGLAAHAATGLHLPVLAPGRTRGANVTPGVPLSAPRPVSAADPAYLLFTSGSTGRPKGVPITHGGLDHYFGLMDERYDFTPDDVFSQATEVNFDCAMFDLFCGWGAGATVHAVPGQAYIDLPAFVNARRMTVWFSTPSAIAVARRRGGLSPASMPTLRWSFFAGEALLCTDAADWQSAAPGAHVENLYGPTELTITISGHRWDPDRSPREAVNGVVPIGTVHPGHRSLLITDDGGVSESEGELCVTGPQMSPGYLDPRDEEGRFLDRDGARWYRTGDRVRDLGGGVLAYLGRRDAQVQIQGWRVELAEVDSAIRSCAGVTDAATVTRPAESGLELVVFYTGAPSSPAVLTRQLRTVLPAGLMPKAFHHLDAFPLNGNRKVDRLTLARRAAEDAVAVA